MDFGQVVIRICLSDPLSKNAVSAFEILCKLLSFTLKDSWRNLADHQCTSITKGSINHIKHNVHVHTTFCHNGGLTRNFMFNGSIYYVLYLQMLRFYLVLPLCSICTNISRRDVVKQNDSEVGSDIITIVLDTSNIGQ